MAGRQRKLWTTGDIADRLGVSRQRAGQLVNDRRTHFPEPFDVLPGNSQVWLIEDVNAWIAKHRPELAEDSEAD